MSESIYNLFLFVCYFFNEDPDQMLFYVREKMTKKL